MAFKTCAGNFAELGNFKGSFAFKMVSREGHRPCCTCPESRKVMFLAKKLPLRVHVLKGILLRLKGYKSWENKKQVSPRSFGGERLFVTEKFNLSDILALDCHKADPPADLTPLIAYCYFRFPQPNLNL